MYDVIGDIHGHLANSKRCCASSDIASMQGAYRHPQGRKAVFVGDLIDRGPEQIRLSTRAGNGRGRLGALHSRQPRMERDRLCDRPARRRGRKAWLRRHSDKNVEQHAKFLQQVGDGSPVARAKPSTAFETLPPVLELDGIRVAHAWWDDEKVDAVAGHFSPGKALDDAFRARRLHRGHPEYVAMEGLTKGWRCVCLTSVSFVDHAGVERFEARISGAKPEARTYAKRRSCSTTCAVNALDHHLRGADSCAAPNAVPTSWAHYWSAARRRSNRRACAVLDYAAARRGPSAPIAGGRARPARWRTSLPVADARDCRDDQARSKTAADPPAGRSVAGPRSKMPRPDAAPRPTGQPPPRKADDDHHQGRRRRRACLFVVAAPSGGGKTSLVNARARARARHPAVGVVHDAPAAPRRSRTASTTTSSTSRGSSRSRTTASSSSTRYVHGNWYATSATWLTEQVAAGPRRAARDRLAGRARRCAR